MEDLDEDGLWGSRNHLKSCEIHGSEAAHGPAAGPEGQHPPQAGERVLGGPRELRAGREAHVQAGDTKAPAQGEELQ